MSRKKKAANDKKNTLHRMVLDGPACTLCGSLESDWGCDCDETVVNVRSNLFPRKPQPDVSGEISVSKPYPKKV